MNFRTRAKWCALMWIMRTLVRVFGVYDTFDAASSCAFWMADDYDDTPAS